jgi:hypothetical protein
MQTDGRKGGAGNLKGVSWKASWRGSEGAKIQKSARVPASERDGRSEVTNSPYRSSSLVRSSRTICRPDPRGLPGPLKPLSCDAGRLSDPPRRRKCKKDDGRVEREARFSARDRLLAARC